MTFANREKSRYKGKPTNLFYLRYGQAVNSFFAYTDAERPITHNGVVYTPIAIMRGRITASGSLDKSTMEVRCTLDTPMAELFRVFPPAQVVNIVIWQGHLSDPDSQFIAAYSGRVVSTTREATELLLSCESIGTSLKRIGLRRHYQYSCPHVLYGSMCRASKDAATTTATVASVSGMTVTLNGGWSSPDRAIKYVNGMIEWQNNAGDIEIRTILRVDNGNDILISAGPRDLRVGAEVKMIFGCNHGLWRNGNAIALETDCMFIHNNIQNYGGCAFIPNKNPIGMRNIYY